MASCPGLLSLAQMGWVRKGKHSSLGDRPFSFLFKLRLPVLVPRLHVFVSWTLSSDLLGTQSTLATVDHHLSPRALP